MNDFQTHWLAIEEPKTADILRPLLRVEAWERQDRAIEALRIVRDRLYPDYWMVATGDDSSPDSETDKPDIQLPSYTVLYRTAEEKALAYATIPPGIIADIRPALDQVA